MAELKTKITDADVEIFLGEIADEERAEDCLTMLKLLKNATGTEPKMWGDKIIGFGTYRYKYKSGREGDWFLAGFAPRKNDLTVYVMSGFSRYDELLAKLGKHKTGKSCLHIKKLQDINLDVLREMIESSVAAVRNGKIEL
jgi:hypothetical protein